MEAKTNRSYLSLVLSGAALALSFLSIFNVFGTLNPIAIWEIHQDRREQSAILRDSTIIMEAQRSLYKRWAESGVCVEAANDLGVYKTEGEHFNNLRVSCDEGNWVAKIQFTANAPYAARFADLLPNSKLDGQTVTLALGKPAAGITFPFNDE